MRAPGIRSGNGIALPPANENGVRTCSRFDCCDPAKPEGGPRQAEYVVVLLLRPAGYAGKPMRMRVGLVVCADHREPIPDKFIQQEDWDRLMQHFDQTGQVRPARILTEVEYVPIADDPDLDGYA